MVSEPYLEHKNIVAIQGAGRINTIKCIKYSVRLDGIGFSGKLFNIGESKELPLACALPILFFFFWQIFIWKKSYDGSQHPLLQGRRPLQGSWIRHWTIMKQFMYHDGGPVLVLDPFSIWYLFHGTSYLLL